MAASMYYPAVFGTGLGFDLARRIVPLIQIIMFGRGATLSLVDPWMNVLGSVPASW